VTLDLQGQIAFFATFGEILSDDILNWLASAF
jgi:hypothetical protein